MKRVNSIGFVTAVASSLALLSGVAALPVAAQTPPGTNAAADITAGLPPALRAAVLAGNTQAVSQAIATLSVGNPAQAAGLADQVVRAAERLFPANPKGAILIAQAAVGAVRNNPVQQAAPQQTESVITIAARLFINPIAARIAPDETGQLVVATINAAATTNNSSLSATTAAQGVGVAEKMLSSNAASAIQIAGAAMQSVKQTSVMSGSPQQSLQVASAVARISVAPEAQTVAPREVAAMAVVAVQVATTPAVYQTSPSAAITVMAQAYAAVNTTTVTAAAPAANSAITGQLTQAAKSTSLGQSNPTNDSQVTQILAKEGPTYTQALATATAAPTLTTNTTPQTQAPQTQIQQNETKNDTLIREENKNGSVSPS
ncbi:hypothetical protein [Azospirillum sp.]|uniref:hypothetical protein n=1 Tax=Azospirillum sp. TaxID=34012 RepID=UPI0026260885|nr:hypothetical protein [Azospirillum sp.]